MPTLTTTAASALLALLMGQPFGPLPPRPGPGGPKQLPPDFNPSTPIHIIPDCSARKTVQLAPVDLMLHHALGDKNLGNRPDLRIDARVRFTASRIFVDVEGKIDERHPRGGIHFGRADTSYANATQIIKQVDVPTGCEIKSVSSTAGSLADKRSFMRRTLYGSGLVDEARCSTKDVYRFRTRRVGCKNISFRAMEVRFREAQTTCPALTVRPTQLPLTGVKTTQGDDDMAGHRPHVRIDTSIAKTASTVRLDTKLEMREDGGDGTRMSRRHSLDLFNASLDAPGCEVATVRYGSGRIRGQSLAAGDHGGRVYGRAPNPVAEGIVATAQCVTDSPGPDTGEIGCAVIFYKPMNITLRKK